MQKIIEHFFGVNHDVSATIILTITVFVLGYLLNGLGNLGKKYFERRSTRKMVIASLKELKPTLDELAVLLGNFVVKVKHEPQSAWSIEYFLHYHPTAIKEIGYKSCFECFFFGIENAIKFNSIHRRKNFSNMWTLLNGVDFMEKKIVSDFDNMSEKYKSAVKAKAEALSDLGRSFREFLSDPNNLSAENYISELKPILGSWFSKPETIKLDHFYTHRQLVLKTRILNRKFQNEVDTQLIEKNCLRMSYCYVQVYEIINHTVNEYKRNIDYLDNSSKLINQIILSLK